ncbi:hypothetical protein, partial [Streptomyces albogriseolus]|uniref:hypothetical protein n=1 Tax=Streptomyces albogriseolus TaxID=1887 RepID=UPI0036AE2F40
RRGLVAQFPAPLEGGFTLGGHSADAREATSAADRRGLVAQFPAPLGGLSTDTLKGRGELREG